MQFVPRVHGNGFIQLDLTPELRLHVWGHPEIPRQATPTPIHDHCFGFQSRILVGQLTNKTYEYRVASYSCDERYSIHQAQVREGEDTILVPNGKKCDLREDRIKSYVAGETYTMQPGEIHESIPVGFTASIIRKDAKTLSQGGASPRVFVPSGTVPDNIFNRYSMPPDWLWSIIARVFEGGKIPNTFGRV